MGFGSQLCLLLWKNFTLRKRQKYRTCAEIVAPLVLVTILVAVRTRPDLKWYHHECHFDGKAMPSVGIVPFLQSFFCAFNNTCYERVTADEMTGSTANYKDSLLTKLIEDVTDVLNDNVDSKLIKDLIGDWKIISTMAHKITDNKTVANIKFLTLFTKPQNIVKRIEDNKIPVTPDVLVHLMNASLDFRQMNRPHISDILQDFDVCPRIRNVSPAKSANEVRELICRSTSMLESLKFQTESSLQMVKSELCRMPGNQIVQLYEIFKTEYNLKHFVFQVLKFVFLNTGKVPNMMKIYGKLKVLFKDLQSLNSTNTDKFRKPLEDLVEFFSHKNNKSNSELLVELMGKFVCGRNSFLKMQSSKSKDLLDRFSSNGPPEFVNQKDGNKNDYGPNSPVCRELVDVMNSDVATKVMWKHLRPVVLGKIPYAPDTPATRKVIKGANQTFSDLAKLVSIAEDWEEYANSVERYLLNSPSIEILRSFSKSCLCDLVENKTRNFVSSNSKINAKISSKDKGVCNFLQLYLDKESGRNGGFDWKRTLFYTKVFARVVAQYGRCFEFNKFVGYASEAELEENSLGLIENNTFWGALVFNVDPKSADLPTHVKYKIRMDTARVDDTKRVVDKYWRPGPRRRAGTETKYLTYGFAYLQDMVDHSIIKLQTGKRDDTGVILQQFPYPCYIEDSFMEAVAKTLPLFLVLAWIFSVAMLCKNIVHEKEKRLKEMMKIMGLGNGVHWLAWFINAFSVMFLTVCLLVTLVKVGKVMEHSDPIILLLFFTSFSIATISQVFLISVFFSQANLAACSAGFLYFIFYQPYSFAKRWEELLTFGQKFAVCLSSNVAFGFGCTYIARFEEQGEGIRWDNIADSPLVDDNFSMLHCILVLLLDACIYGLITWYVEAVFPGEYGIPRPFYFFLQWSYWCGPSKDNNEVQEDLFELDDAVGANIERNPTNGVLGVAIRNLKKVYNNKKVAVDGLNLNFFEGQITSFLGHNGAGKTTTMSILTGLFPPTEGTAYIYGQDITTKMETIRNSLGLCPQYNALFNFLTVEEHLWFYTRLKGLDSEEANRETEQLINDIQLPHKRNAFPKMLSGGMKRKLSVAIAFVGNAKTVILDEPTAGVDPYARRSIWELLLKLKENRTIILSTHHMDEADVLGDRIAIISKGKLCCCGSSLFLKSRYGNGYYLTLVREDAEEIEDADGDEYEMIYENVLPVIRNKRRKPPRHDVDEGFAERTCEGDVGYLMPYPPPDGTLRPGFSVKRLSAFIKKYVAKAQLTEDNKAELTYQLPDFGSQTGLFIRLFRELELCHEGLGISSFGISDTSLEEVFLRVAERAGDGIPSLLALLGPTDETKRKRLEEASDGGRVPRPVTQMSFRRNKRKAFLRYPQQQQFVQPVDEDVYLEPMPAVARELGYNQTENIHEPIPVIEREPGFNHKEQVKLEGKQLLLHHFIAVIIRRFHHFKRSKKGFVCELVMPAFFVLLAMVFAEIDPPFTNSPPLELHPWQLVPPRGNSRLYMFFSNDAVGSNFGDSSVKMLISNVGVGNRCMDSKTYSISGFPCKNVSANAEWLSDPNPRKRNTVVDCSCNTGALVCPADAGGLEPKRTLLPSNDYLYDMTGYNITDWLVKTAGDYRKRRYGGLSFGVKSQWARASTDHIKQLMNLITNEMEEEASRHTMKVWTAMEDVMARIASHNISRVWYNNKGWPAVVIYMNVVNNIILRSNLPSYVDPSEFGITTVNHPMNMTKQQSQDEARMTSKTDIIISTCVIFAMSFIPASFVMILIEERVSDSKHLQFVSGMSPNVYWLANFVWDMLNYMVSATFCIFIFLAFQRESYVGKDTLPCLIALLLMYGWAMIPVMYPFSRVFRVPSTAMVTLKSINIFLGTTSTLATFILEFLAEDDATLMKVNNILKEVLLVLPQFCLGQGLLDLSRTQIVTSAFKKYEISASVNPMTWSQNGRNLLSMFVCGLGFFLINILIENFFIKKRPKKVPYSEVLDEDADVSRERTRIEMDGAEDDILRIENMSKTYRLPNGKGQHTAVDRLCLGVPKGQCFGLLGVNGAGKTTTFKMLTGYLSMTSGNAYINGFNINTAIDEVRRSIGYCPQFDAFDPLLTAKEILCFYARVKGIPSADVNVVVDWAVKKLGLTQHADRPSGTYSGGNKRKLSTAIALIGNPSVIFLDEPTAGMDPGARRFLWNCINNIVKDGRSVILTSHSMEECEALCGRLAIMVNGRFRCIGSIQHLKTKFGEGYTLILRVAGEQPDMKSLESFIKETFPAAVLREKHHNMLQYQLGTSAQLSQIFGEIEAVKHSFNIEDYSISQTTLDQVFINFAKMQTDMLDAEAADESGDTDGSLESRRTSTVTMENVSQRGSVANLISVNRTKTS